MQDYQLVKELQSALSAALEWIDAVPGSAIPPVMPGFDREWADALIRGGCAYCGEIGDKCKCEDA